MKAYRLATMKIATFLAMMRSLYGSPGDRADSAVYADKKELTSTALFLDEET